MFLWKCADTCGLTHPGDSRPVLLTAFHTVAGNGMSVSGGHRAWRLLWAFAVWVPGRERRNEPAPLPLMGAGGRTAPPPDFGWMQRGRGQFPALMFNL